MEVMDDGLWTRFQALRLYVISDIQGNIKEGAFHRSYEGRVEITFEFSDCFRDPEGIAGEPNVRIRLYDSMRYNNRFCEWKGDTFSQALQAAERDIYEASDVL